jgi:leucyl-tRNA synthetase
MHKALVERYVEVSTLLLAPITPHTSEHVWSNVLKREGSVLTAGAFFWRRS